MKRQRWYSSGPFEIGLECLGEWKMDCPRGTLEVRSLEGDTILRRPSERFHVPYWNAQYFEPHDWNNPLIGSQDGRFLIVYWLPKSTGFVPLVLDLERSGAFRLPSHGTPRRIVFVPDGTPIELQHHLSPYYADLLLKDWESDKSAPVQIALGTFESFDDVFGPEPKHVEQDVGGQPPFSVSTTSPSPSNGGGATT